MRFTFTIYDEQHFVEWDANTLQLTTDFPTVEELVSELVGTGVMVVVDLFQNEEPAGLQDEYVAFGTIKTALEMIVEVKDIECDAVPDSWDEKEMWEAEQTLARRDIAKKMLQKFRG